MEKDDPQVKDNYVKVKVHRTGICGYDVNLFWRNEKNEQNFMEGHEFSVEIINPNGSDFKKGYRVVIISMSPYYECEYCKSDKLELCDSVFNEINGLSIYGGFGEYVIVRKDLLRKLPDNISYTQAAIIEPVTISYHGAKLANIKEGDNVLVTGGGPIGLFAALSASLLGAKSVNITEANKDRIEILKEASFVSNVFNGLSSDLDDQLNELAPDGFDAVLECSGNKNAATTRFNQVKKGGNFIVLAIGNLPDFNVNKLVNQEFTIKSSIMFSIEEFKEVLQLMADDKIHIEKYSHLIKMEDVQETLEKIVNGEANKIKYIINISED